MKYYIFMLLLLCSCSSTNTNIVQIAQTCIGIKVSYNPEIQLPEGYLGFSRSVLVIMPTATNNPNNTADMIIDFTVDAGFFSGIKISDKIIIGDPARQHSNATARAMFQNTTARDLIFNK